MINNKEKKEWVREIKPTPILNKNESRRLVKNMLINEKSNITNKEKNIIKEMSKFPKVKGVDIDGIRRQVY